MNFRPSHCPYPYLLKNSCIPTLSQISIIQLGRSGRLGFILGDSVRRKSLTSSMHVYSSVNWSSTVKSHVHKGSIESFTRSRDLGISVCFLFEFFILHFVFACIVSFVLSQWYFLSVDELTMLKPILVRMHRCNMQTKLNNACSLQRRTPKIFEQTLDDMKKVYLCSCHRSFWYAYFKLQNLSLTCCQLGMSSSYMAPLDARRIYIHVAEVSYITLSKWARYKYVHDWACPEPCHSILSEPAPNWSQPYYYVYNYKHVFLSAWVRLFTKVGFDCDITEKRGCHHAFDWHQHQLRWVTGVLHRLHCPLSRFHSMPQDWWPSTVCLIESSDINTPCTTGCSIRQPCFCATKVMERPGRPRIFPYFF